MNELNWTDMTEYQRDHCCMNQKLSNKTLDIVPVDWHGIYDEIHREVCRVDAVREMIEYAKQHGRENENSYGLGIFPKGNVMGF